MDLRADFLREFQPALDSLCLPEGLAASYQPESCLAQNPLCSTWIIRRRADGARFILRFGTDEELRGEFEAMGRLPQELAGRVPLPVEFCEENGVQYLVRTYLPGRSLAEAWEAGEHTEAQCAALGKSLCQLLDRLHRLSPPVIHRDVKPENIVLSPEGEPGLIDFGIARTYDPEQDTDTIRSGTRSTAAPEQYGFTQSDQRTDLYALGCTMRWMITGSYQPEALDGADCSMQMKRFLRKAAAFDPANRFPSAAAMGKALARMQQPVSKRVLPAAAVCLLAVLLVIFAWYAAEQRPVKFASPLLEEAVRAELGQPEGPVRRKDLAGVRRLAIVGQKVLGENQTFRYNLDVYVDEVSQMEEPRGDIADLSLLAEMPNLTSLNLSRQAVCDLTPLAGLPLREVYLCGNQITDLTPLEGLAELEVLYLGSNPLEDLTPLASLTGLRELNLDFWDWTELASLRPLAGLGLESLSLGNVTVLDGSWDVLGTLEHMRTLFLWTPPVEAFAALPSCGALRELKLGNYQQPDLTDLPELPKLNSMGIFNTLSSIEGIQKQAGIRWLSFCNQDLAGLEPAGALEELEELYLFNVTAPSFAPLLEAPALTLVSVDTEEVGAAVRRDCPGHRFSIFVP